MGNGSIGSVTNNEHQKTAKFFKPTISPKAYPVSENLANATPYPNVPLNLDLSVTVAVAQGHEFDSIGNGMDERERERLRKRQRNREAVRKWKFCKKLELKELQAKVEAISSETSMLTKKIRRYSEECSVLKSENKALLEEMRELCDQETMSRLQSMDPCHRFSDDEPENSSQNEQASYKSDPEINASSSD